MFHLSFFSLLLCIHLVSAQETPTDTVTNQRFPEPVQLEDPADSQPAFPIAVVVTFSVIAVMAVISVTGVCCHRRSKARRDKKEAQRIRGMPSTLEETSEVYPNPYSLQSSLFSPPPLPTVGTGMSGPSSLRDAQRASSFYSINMGESNLQPSSVNSRRNSLACLTPPSNLFRTTASEHSNASANANCSDFLDPNRAVATSALPADAIVTSDDFAPARGSHDGLRRPPKLEEEELASAISRISRIASIISENASSAYVSNTSYPRHPFPYATNHRRISSSSSAIIRFGEPGEDPKSNAGHDVNSDEEQIDEKQSQDMNPSEEKRTDKSDDEEIQDLKPVDGDRDTPKTAVEDAANDIDASGTEDSSETLTSRNESSSLADVIDSGFSFGLSEKERRRIDRDDGQMCTDEDARTFSSDFEGSANESLNGHRQNSYDGNTQWQRGYDSDDGSSQTPIQMGYPSPYASVVEVHANDATAGSTEIEPSKHVISSPRISIEGTQGHSQMSVDDALQRPRANTLPATIDPYSIPRASLLHPGSIQGGFDLTAMGNVTVSPPSMASSPSSIPSLRILSHPREFPGDGLPRMDDGPLPPPLPIGRSQKHHSLPHTRPTSGHYHLSPYYAHPQPPFRHQQHSLTGYSQSSYSTSSTSFSSLVLSEAAMAAHLQQQNRHEAERQHESRRSALSRHPDLASLMLDDRRGEAEAHRGAY